MPRHGRMNLIGFVLVAMCLSKVALAGNAWGKGHGKGKPDKGDESPPYCAPPVSYVCSPPPVTVSSPPPYSCPPPVTVSSPPPYVCSPPPVTVASPPPYVCSPPPVTVSSPPPVVYSPPPYVCSPPPVTVSSPPPYVCSPPPVTVSSPPPYCYSPPAVQAAKPPPYCAPVVRKPPKGPACGATTYYTKKGYKYYKHTTKTYCKSGQKCCKVPTSWGKKSSGPKCHKKVKTQRKCYYQCPKWWW